MSTRLRVFESVHVAQGAYKAETCEEGDTIAFFWNRPGWCWPIPANDIPDRKCWAIVLPGKAGIWTTVDHASDPGNPLWDVTGEPPNLTVNPSIDASPKWHGWIRDGKWVPA